MKKLTRDLVVPIISARVSRLILGMIGCGLPCLPKFANKAAVALPGGDNDLTNRFRKIAYPMTGKSG